MGMEETPLPQESETGAEETHGTDTPMVPEPAPAQEESPADGNMTEEGDNASSGDAAPEA